MLECCSPVIEESYLHELLDDLDFNELYRDDFFEKVNVNQKFAKGMMD